MITRIKLLILRVLSNILRRSMSKKGIKFSGACWIHKMPHIQMVKGSSISLGSNVTLISTPRFNPLVEHPVSLRTLTPQASIEIADNAGISGSNLVCCNKISIGEYTIIGPGTLIYDSEGHDYSPEVGWSQRKVRTGRPIHIGSKCFIGARCIILSGVTIGDNCVIAAGTVVTQDIPAGHKAYGNPAVYDPLPKVLGGVGRKKKASTVSNIDN